MRRSLTNTVGHRRLLSASRLVWSCALILPALLSLAGCVKSPVRESPVPKVKVEAEWHSMEADRKALEAMKEQRRQAMQDRRPPPESGPQPNGQTPPSAHKRHAPATPVAHAESRREFDHAGAEIRRPPPQSTFPVQRAEYRQRPVFESSRSQPASTRHDRTPRALDRPRRTQSVAGRTSEVIEIGGTQSSLRLLGFVEDGDGQVAAMVEIPQQGPRLIRAGDTILWKFNGQPRSAEVREVTSRELRVKDGHEEKTIYFQK